MHRLKSNWGRSVPAVATALAAAAALALIVAMNLGGGSSSVVASTISPTPPWNSTQLQKFTGVTCTDFYLDQAPTNLVGTAPGAEDLIVASALTRTEPSATANKLDITIVTYQGSDLVKGDEPFFLDSVPDDSPTFYTCGVARTSGQNFKRARGYVADALREPVRQPADRSGEHYHRHLQPGKQRGRRRPEHLQ
jgi:hypothetical protein